MTATATLYRGDCLDVLASMEPEYMQIAEARIRHHLGALFAHRVQVIETEEGAA